MSVIEPPPYQSDILLPSIYSEGTRPHIRIRDPLRRLPMTAPPINGQGHEAEKRSAKGDKPIAYEGLDYCPM